MGEFLDVVVRGVSVHIHNDFLISDSCMVMFQIGSGEVMSVEMADFEVNHHFWVSVEIGVVFSERCVLKTVPSLFDIFSNVSGDFLHFFADFFSDGSTAFMVVSLFEGVRFTSMLLLLTFLIFTSANTHFCKFLCDSLIW